METKKCTTCKEEKPKTDFIKCKTSKDKLGYYCSFCRKISKSKKSEATKLRDKQYRIENREKRRLYNIEYIAKNKEKHEQAVKKYREENKELISEKAKLYRLKPEAKAREKINGTRNQKSEKSKSYKKKYREENRQLYRDSAKKHYYKNKEAIQQKHRDRMANEPLYRLKRKIRDAIKNALAKKGYSKNGRTQEILGCDYNFFIQYIEAQFIEGMNWSNATIDHIKPLKTALTEEDVILLNHYTNLQPLFLPDNSSKSAKLITKQLRLI